MTNSSAQRSFELKTNLNDFADQYEGLLATLGLLHPEKDEIAKIEFGEQFSRENNMKKPRDAKHLHAGDIPLKFTIQSRKKEEHTIH